MKSNVSAACLLAIAFTACGPSAAQQISGTLGSPSATTTIDGKQLPPPPAKFEGGIEQDAKDFQALVASDGRAAQGRAQCSSDHDGRRGLRGEQRIRWCDSDADHGAHREGGTALHAISFHRALLADACCDHHRPQSPFRRIRRDQRNGHWLSGVRLHHRSGECHRRPSSERQRLRHVHGSARTTIHHPSSTARPGLSTNGRAEWASSISMASWAARPTSGRRIYFVTTRRFIHGSGSRATISSPTWLTMLSVT